MEKWQLPLLFQLFQCFTVRIWAQLTQNGSNYTVELRTNGILVTQTSQVKACKKNKENSFWVSIRKIVEIIFIWVKKMKSFCSKKSFSQILFVFEDDAVIFFHMQCCEKVSSLRRVLLFMPSTFLRYPVNTKILFKFWFRSSHSILIFQTLSRPLWNILM